MRIIGHRGAGELADENTVSSFQKAIECGVDMIETDVRKIGGTLYLTHDRVETAENLITLKEALKTFKIPWNLELKEEGCEAEVLELVKEFSSEVLISSFQIKILEKVRALDKNVKLGYIFDWEQSVYELVERLNLHSLHPNDSVVEPYTLNQFRKNNVKVFVWTVNNKGRAEVLRKMGVDGLITDRPDIIKK